MVHASCKEVKESKIFSGKDVRKVQRNTTKLYFFSAGKEADIEI